MDLIDQILEHPLFRYSMKRINELEKDRIFCCHGIGHGLDVARCAYIAVLKDGLPISKEVIYGAALLHDIGRWKEYEEGIPHEKASARIAAEILAETDFSSEEQKKILTVIASHRNKEETETDIFSEILYQADKESRPCFLCAARSECYWSEEKKNKTIRN